MKKIVYVPLFCICLNFLPAVAQKVEYARQEIWIGKISCLNNQFRDNVEGMIVNFSCTLKYGKDQIVGADTNSTYRNFYIYPEIHIGNSLLFHPVNEPASTVLSATTDFYQVMEAQKPERKKDLSFFIPYHRFFISAGDHNCRITIHATNQNRTIIFEKLKKDSLLIRQPRMCVSLLNVKNLQVKYKENYDVAGRNIPIWNLFYGKKSQRGYGYPDVQWEVNVGRDAVYSSGIAWDAFSGNDGTCIFQSAPADPVDFYASDYDMFNQDDRIGYLRIGQRSQSEEKHLSGFSFEEVKSVSLDYFKRLVPMLKRKSLHLETAQKQNGVSGVRVMIDYTVDQPNELIPIIARPYLSAGSTDDFSDRYMKAENQARYYKTGGYSISSANAQGSIDVFYPYYLLSGGEIPNCRFSIGQYDVPFDRTENKQAVVVPEIDDVIWGPLKGSETSRNGLFGILIDAGQRLPEAYTTAFPPNRFTYKYVLTPSVFGKTSADTLFTATQRFFLPYCMMKFSPGSKAAAELMRQVILQPDSGRHVSIGKQKAAFDFTMPAMRNVQITSVRLKLDALTCDQGDQIVLIHGKDTVVLATMDKNIFVGKLRVKGNVVGQKMYVHPNDVGVLCLITKPHSSLLRSSRYIAIVSVGGMKPGGKKFSLIPENGLKKGKLGYTSSASGASDK